jgi:hypothetical protein
MKHRKRKPTPDEKKIIDLVKNMVGVMRELNLLQLLPPVFRESYDIEKMLDTLSPDKDKPRKERLQEISLSLFETCSPFLVYHITTTTEGNDLLQ